MRCVGSLPPTRQRDPATPVAEEAPPWPFQVIFVKVMMQPNLPVLLIGFGQDKDVCNSAEDFLHPVEQALFEGFVLDLTDCCQLL